MEHNQREEQLNSSFQGVNLDIEGLEHDQTTSIVQSRFVIPQKYQDEFSFSHTFKNSNKSSYQVLDSLSKPSNLSNQSQDELKKINDKIKEIKQHGKEIQKKIDEHINQQDNSHEPLSQINNDNIQNNYLDEGNRFAQQLQQFKQSQQNLLKQKKNKQKLANNIQQLSEIQPKSYIANNNYKNKFQSLKKYLEVFQPEIIPFFQQLQPHTSLTFFQASFIYKPFSQKQVAQCYLNQEQNLIDQSKQKVITPWMMNISKSDNFFNKLIQYSWRNIVSLSLTWCNLRNDDFNGLVKNAHQFPNLKILILNNNWIQTIIFQDLTILRKNTSLQILSLLYNRLTVQSVGNIGFFLILNQRQRSLKLFSEMLNISNCQYLFQNINLIYKISSAEWRFVTTLSLDKNRLNNQGWRQLMNIIERMPNVRYINLRNNQISYIPYSDLKTLNEFVYGRDQWNYEGFYYEHFKKQPRKMNFVTYLRQLKIDLRLNNLFNHYHNISGITQFYHEFKYPEVAIILQNQFMKYQMQWISLKTYLKAVLISHYHSFQFKDGEFKQEYHPYLGTIIKNQKKNIQEEFQYICTMISQNNRKQRIFTSSNFQNMLSVVKQQILGKLKPKQRQFISSVLTLKAEQMLLHFIQVEDQVRQNFDIQGEFIGYLFDNDKIGLSKQRYKIYQIIRNNDKTMLNRLIDHYFKQMPAQQLIKTIIFSHRNILKVLIQNQSLRSRYFSSEALSIKHKVSEQIYNNLNSILFQMNINPKYEQLMEKILVRETMLLKCQTTNFSHVQIEQLFIKQEMRTNIRFQQWFKMYILMYSEIYCTIQRLWKHCQKVLYNKPKQKIVEKNNINKMVWKQNKLNITSSLFSNSSSQDVTQDYFWDNSQYKSQKMKQIKQQTQNSKKKDKDQFDDICQMINENEFQIINDNEYLYRILLQCIEKKIFAKDDILEIIKFPQQDLYYKIGQKNYSYIIDIISEYNNTMIISLINTTCKEQQQMEQQMEQQMKQQMKQQIIQKESIIVKQEKYKQIEQITYIRKQKQSQFMKKYKKSQFIQSIIQVSQVVRVLNRPQQIIYNQPRYQHQQTVNQINQTYQNNQINQINNKDQEEIQFKTQEEFQSNQQKYQQPFQSTYNYQVQQQSEQIQQNNSKNTVMFFFFDQF